MGQVGCRAFTFGEGSSGETTTIHREVRVDGSHTHRLRKMSSSAPEVQLPQWKLLYVVDSSIKLKKNVMFSVSRELPNVVVWF